MQSYTRLSAVYLRQRAGALIHEFENETECNFVFRLAALLKSYDSQSLSFGTVCHELSVRKICGGFEIIRGSPSLETPAIRHVLRSCRIVKPGSVLAGLVKAMTHGANVYLRRVGNTLTVAAGIGVVMTLQQNWAAIKIGDGLYTEVHTYDTLKGSMLGEFHVPGECIFSILDVEQSQYVNGHGPADVTRYSIALTR